MVSIINTTHKKTNEMNDTSDIKILIKFYP
jgi:hypothetical protein